MRTFKPEPTFNIGGNASSPCRGDWKTRALGILRANGIALLLLAFHPTNACGKNWKYEALAQDVSINSSGIASNSPTSVLEFKSIQTGGYRTARVFVQLLQSDFYKNKGDFTYDSKLRIACFHQTKYGSSPYYEVEVPTKCSTYISGWAEIPIVGPELRVIVWGDNLPKVDMKADFTIYLLR